MKKRNQFFRFHKSTIKPKNKTNTPTAAMKFSTSKFTVAVVILYTWSLVAVAQNDEVVQYIDLLGDALFPEGILPLPDGRILVGGFGDGSLQLIDPTATSSNNSNSNTPTYLSRPGENGMVIAVGFAYDESTDLLWVSNFNFNTSAGVPGSQLKVFNLTSSELVATIPEEFINGAFFNEVTLTDDGTAYVTDTFQPTIWVAPNTSAVEVFVTDDLLKNPVQPFGLNGLSLSPDGTYLIASVMDRLDAGDGRLVRITLSTREVVDIELQNSINETSDAVAGFAGSDGMFFYEDGLYMVNVYSSSGAIYRATFSDDYSVATLTILDAFQDVYNRPTSSALVGNTFWTVQSQLDHIIDDENGALGTPPELPFQIVGVPFYTLLLDTPLSSPSSPIAPTPGTAPSASPPTTAKNNSTSSAWNMFDHTSNALQMFTAVLFIVTFVTV